jgi:alcohol dehydrogenase class IV
VNRAQGKGDGVNLLIFNNSAASGDSADRTSKDDAFRNLLPTGAMQIRKFSSPEIVFGEGAFALLGRYAAQFRSRRALLVTDMGVRRTGWAGRAEELLRLEGVAWSVYERDAFQPKDQEIMAGADDYLRQRCNLVIAVGGGSVMDCAKGICAVVGNGRHILSLAGGEGPILPGPPLICAPTTPGSGAEASQFVVLSDSRRRRKLVAVGRALVPSLTLVDPAAAATLTPQALARSALDALSHAIEAYVSTARSSLSDLHALEAVRILGGLLSNPAIDSHNATHRLAASLGGLHAGLAFSNAGLGLAHALAHALETLTGMTHIECLAWALPAAVRYNYAVVPERYLEVGRMLGATPDTEAAGGSAPADDAWLVNHLSALVDKTQLTPQRLLALLPEAWPAQVSELALSSVFAATNPKFPTPDELERWLAQSIM